MRLINRDKEMNQSVEQSTARQQGNKRHNVSARKANETTCARKELMGMLKQRWYFFTPSWLVASCLCTRMQASHKQRTTSVAFPPIMRDVSLQSTATDVDSSISLASSQNSCNVKTRFSYPLATALHRPNYIRIRSRTFLW